MKVPGSSEADLDPEVTSEVAPAMKHFFAMRHDSSLEASADFTISLRSLPFLADHAFQDMIVLPGSFYIEMALSVHQEFYKRAPRVLGSVIFENPILLSPEDTIIRVDVRKKGDSTREYTFFEAAVGNGGAPNLNQYAARLEIEFGPPADQESLDEPFSVDAFQEQAHDAIDSVPFYKELRDSGNQYGPLFRCISRIWRAGNQSLGELSLPRAESEPFRLRTTLLDSMTQLLAPFMVAQGRTFVLRSIDRIEISDLKFSEPMWCHATLRPDAGIVTGVESGGESKRVVGDVRCFDQSGKTQVKLSGVSLIFLDRAEAADASAALKLAIASNFTAEPVEEALKFWAAHFNLQVNTEFAPYDQVFQQLLQAESGFRGNSAGVNIILLQLEKWAAIERGRGPGFDKERAERCFGKRKRCNLPNGLEIVHLNQHETDYLYKEIFEDESYLKHGVVLPDGATVVDIGANIGLFSLFVMSRCQKPRIYAFEPAPAVYDLLKANCEVYGTDAHVFNFGVSNRHGTANFTFYENSSVFSTFRPNDAEDRDAIQAVVRNILNAESVVGEPMQEHVNELTADRLRRSIHECPLTTVSDIIRENQIDRIDLLKIDAEKSELEIIEGIADCDWPRIDQIVMEIHDPAGNVFGLIRDLLIRKGYRCAIDQEKLLEHSGLFNLFATRNANIESIGLDSERVQSAAGPKPMQATSLQRNVQNFCDALQSFTTEVAAPLVLCVCPASPSVKDDVELKAAIARAEQEILSRASTMSAVSTITSEALSRRYPVDDFYDRHAHELGDIPYTPECYAAIGTALFRTIFNLKRKPFKVIVLDCDNTLWKGVCGEVSAEEGGQGVAVTEHYRALQQFMVDQTNAGMLLCLCSKNNEHDVLEVFDERADMLLRREHLASWRINWSRKSENIKSLASELNLALDSFIFIDDNPVDCAEVEINCPGVLALRLPQDPVSFGSFLDHIWAFDHDGTTAEDRNRASLYKDNTQREHFRAQTSLSAFIAELMLRVEIAEATEDQLGRVSQLTYRTNQFNFTTIRRSPSQIRDLLKRENIGCLTVRVSDRFGDYGLVGVVVYESEVDRLKLDTFLLSCRVLGRGVEHAVLSSIGKRALNAGKTFVELTCVPTERNLPAREFLISLGDKCQERYQSQDQEKAWESFLFSAEYLAGLQYNPDAYNQNEESGQSSTEQLRSGQSNEKLAKLAAQKTPPAAPSGFGITTQSVQLRRIGEELCDISRIAKAIDEFHVRATDSMGGAKNAPFGQAETVVANIWRKVLGRPGIGLDANFFDVGGTSLKAVQIIAMLQKELKQKLSIVSLYECPTVRLLAARLSASAGDGSSESSTIRAALRGQQRRSRAVRRIRSQ